MKRKDDCGIDFFSVSLVENLETLTKSIPILNNYYKRSTFTIICPEKSIPEFENAFQNYSNIDIVDENSILTMDIFRAIANKIFTEFGIENEITNKFRMNWYYQQVLKLSYAIIKNREDLKIVMWDADTIPLKKISFFKNNESVLHGSLNEFNKPYFKTLKTLFGELPENFRAFTVQFFSSSHNEMCFLISNLEKYQKNTYKSIGEWLSNIILKSVIETHGTLYGSLISEQEVVGISNYIYQNSQVSQKNIIYIRFRLTGLLNKYQIKVVKNLGFTHVTYEMWSIVNKNQNWVELLLIILKEYYTSFKYYISKPRF